MKTYTELKKNIKKYRDAAFEKTVSIAVLGDTATQFISTAICGMGYEYGIRADVYDAEYDTIDADVIDAGSELYSRARDYVILYLSAEKAYEAFCLTPLTDRENFADVYIAKVQSYWDEVSDKSSAKLLQFNFNSIDDGVFGNFGMKEPSSFEFQLQRLNLLLSEHAAEQKNVFVIDIAGIQVRLGRNVFCDPKFYFQARMSIGLEAVVYVAKNVYDVIFAISGRLRKCLVLDLDNTLWGGVIGDDGLNGIEIGELGMGRAYTDLQRWFLELERRGILLTVCSKNDENTAKEPFEKHPDMLLHLSDFAMFVANWDDKATNIKKIRETLNIGMDSMVFIDDNPFERNLVREMIPEITVPELPEDPSEYLSFLQAEDLFETASFSGEDMKRTEQYREEAGRRTLEQTFASVDDYLKSLEMKAEAKPFDEFHYPRIAQLSQRSNQFNLRTVRYTEEDIRRIAESEKYITMYFTLKDRFGDYGLISAVILEKRADSELFIDTWFMSCRVLKRGMEEFIINSVLDAAKEAGASKVTGEYLRTPKNNMVCDIYEKLGFLRISDSLFETDTEGYEKKRTYIT